MREAPAARVYDRPRPAEARHGRHAAAAVKPIDLYYWPTPNGWKVSIMLEECGLPYNVIPVNIARGDQFKPAFLKISPNNRMPAIVDPDGPGGRPISVSSPARSCSTSAARPASFIPPSERAPGRGGQWLFWQMANLGPKAGEANHFRRYAAAEKQPYATARFVNELNRLYGVMNTRLKDRALSGRRLFDRRHGLRRLDQAVPSARARLRRLPASQALARRGACAARGAARHAHSCRGGEPGRRHRSEGARNLVRTARAMKRADRSTRQCRATSRWLSGRQRRRLATCHRAARMTPCPRFFVVNGRFRRSAVAGAFTFNSAHCLNHHSNFLLMIAPSDRDTDRRG